MNDESLIEARGFTEKLLVKTLRELCFVIIVLFAISLIAEVYFPFIIPKFAPLVYLSLGAVFGTVFSVVRIYHIFWNKFETEYQRKERLKRIELKMEIAKEIGE